MLKIPKIEKTAIVYMALARGKFLFDLEHSSIMTLFPSGDLGIAEMDLADMDPDEFYKLAQDDKIAFERKHLTMQEFADLCDNISEANIRQIMRQWSEQKNERT